MYKNPTHILFKVGHFFFNKAFCERGNRNFVLILKTLPILMTKCNQNKIWDCFELIFSIPNIFFVPKSKLGKNESKYDFKKPNSIII